MTSISTASAALMLPGQWDSRSLTMPEGADLSDYEQAWGSLDGADDSIRFWKGDLIVQARAKWGDEAEGQLYGPERANNHDNDAEYARVAERIPPHLRGADMSWSAHKALAGVKTPLEREQFVLFAQEHGWKSKECEVRVSAYKGGDIRFCDPDISVDVLDAANKARREKANAGSRGPVRVVDNFSDSELSEDEDTGPVFGKGDFGGAVDTERADREPRGTTDGFDDIERMRKSWAKLTPDLHIRFLRSVMTLDLFLQIEPDFHQSRVEPSSSSAPRVAPGVVHPRAGGALSSSASDPRTGDDHNMPEAQRNKPPLGSLAGRPGFDADGEAIPPSWMMEKT